MAQIKREQTLPAECLSFLHLGDIHFPELMNAHLLADHKDKGISNELAGRIGSTRLAEISRGMEEIRKNELRLVAIISTGDLTTKGDLAGYRDCLNFLGGALNLSDDKYWENRRFFVVPGNHDIDRSTIVPGQDIQNKFLPLLEQWQSIFSSRESPYH